MKSTRHGRFTIGQHWEEQWPQAEIEQHLHEARTLVTQAQEAAERGGASAS